MYTVAKDGDSAGSLSLRIFKDVVVFSVGECDVAGSVGWESRGIMCFCMRMWTAGRD